MHCDSLQAVETIDFTPRYIYLEKLTHKASVSMYKNFDSSIVVYSQKVEIVQMSTNYLEWLSQVGKLK